MKRLLHINGSSTAKWIAASLALPSAVSMLHAQTAVPVLKPKTGLKPFEHTESPAALPNYVAGAKWGTQAEPIRTMQKPLAPEESMKHLVTFPGFNVSLFVSEPEITKPIWLTWDERGRLWIAETVDYPNNMQPAGQGNDRIKICEDTNGDGRADKFTVFADRLSIPTSLVFANGGIIVAQAPDMIFLQDTDGDDKADVRKVVMTGWGTRDTHAGPSNLRYGHDNWIWGAVGYSGFNGNVGGKKIEFGQGVFRMKADGSELEFVRSSNNNTWGLGLSEDGLVFGSTANNNCSMFVSIPNRYFEAVKGWSASRLETIADSQNFYPISEKVRQVDWHDRYTAGAGSALYTARSFPKEYWNKAQFVCEPTGHLIGKFRLEPKGADFVARNEKNFAASDDEWASPIAAEVGPDGALWVIDWYNYIIQHNPVPQGFSNGKGNAYETPLRDKTNGRIYRIAHADSKPSKVPKLSGAKSGELVEALQSDNLLWRMHAQRLLVAKGSAEPVPALLNLLAKSKPDEIGINSAALHALWTLHGLGVLSEGNAKALAGTVTALKNSSAAVRRGAAMVLPRNEKSREAILRAGLLKDSEPQVRLVTLLALAEMPASDESGKAIFAMIKEPENRQDRLLAEASVAAAAQHDSGFLKALGSAGKIQGDLARLPFVIQTVSTHYAQKASEASVLQLVLGLDGMGEELATPVLDGLAAGWPSDKKPVFSEGDQKKLKALVNRLSMQSKDRLLALARKWGLEKSFEIEVAQVVDWLKKQMALPSSTGEQRIGAAKRLIGHSETPDTAQLILSHVTSLTSPQLSGGLIGAIAESRQQPVGQVLLDHWSNYTPAARRTVITAFLRKSDWTALLLDGVEKGKLSRGDLAAEHWTQLKNSRNSAISSRAEKLSMQGAISADREAIVQKLTPLAKEKGDAARGQEIYTANCANCHAFHGKGGKIGPDLTGIGSRDRADILLEILDPNRSVEANYRLWTLSTKDGETISGLLESETQTSVEILDTAGQKHAVQRQKIERLEATQNSIMPNGFESIPEKDLVALLEYLSTPH